MKIHEPPFLLKEIKIELTYKCPLACLHCSSDATPDSASTISPDYAISIIEQAKKLCVKEIAFSGGEPLLYNEIENLVKISTIGGMNVLIYTSGNIDDFGIKIKNLKKAGLQKVIFSLYSPDKDSHENITRIFGSYDATVGAIKSAIRVGLDVELHFVALARNYRNLPQLAEFASSHGIKRVSVLRFVPQGRGFLLSRDTLTESQNIELKRLIESLRVKGYDIRTGSPFNFLRLSDQPKCNSAIDRLIVAPDLRIYPCDAFKQILAEELVGTSQYSILNGSNLEECWEKSIFLGAIRNYLTSPFSKPCEDCEFIESCVSGCLAQKALDYGSLEKRPDPACLRKFYEEGF